MSGHQWQVGDELTVAWKIGDGQTIQVQCTVRRVTENQTGVEFLNLSLADRLRISQFLGKAGVTVS